MVQTKRKILIGFLISMILLLLILFGVIYSNYPHSQSTEDRQPFCIFTYQNRSVGMHYVETNISEPGLYTLEVNAYSRSDSCVTIQGNLTLKDQNNGSVILSQDIFDTNCKPFREDYRFTLHQFYTLNITHRGNYSIQINLTLTYRLNLYLYQNIPSQIIQQEINAEKLDTFVPWILLAISIGIFVIVKCIIVLWNKTPIRDIETPLPSSKKPSSGSGRFYKYTSKSWRKKKPNKGGNNLPPKVNPAGD